MINRFKTPLLLALLTVLMVLMDNAIGGQTGMFLAFVLALANALRKLHAAAHNIPMPGAQPVTAHMFIVNPLAGSSAMKCFSTHPPMDERIARLEAIARGRYE